jgi:hypothetical protein
VSRRLPRNLLIWAVSVHSLVLGTVLIVAPGWVHRLVGWSDGGPHFFVRQGGVFLLILGGTYLGALRHPPLLWLLVCSKAAAVVFLLAESVGGESPRLVLVAALLDAVMCAGAAIFVIRDKEARSAETPIPG